MFFPFESPHKKASRKRFSISTKRDFFNDFSETLKLAVFLIHHSHLKKEFKKKITL